LKNICAIIPEKKLDAVNTALHELGVEGLTIFETKGRGKDFRKPNQMGNLFYSSEFGENNTIMILASDADVNKIVDVIQANAELGKIFVTNIEELIDIAKNTRGEDSL